MDFVDRTKIHFTEKICLLENVQMDPLVDSLEHGFIDIPFDVGFLRLGISNQ